MTERIVAWQHFARVADGPNPGPRLRLATRIYGVLVRISRELHLDSRVLDQPGRTIGFELESLRSVTTSSRKIQLLLPRVGDEGFDFLSEVLLHVDLHPEAGDLPGFTPLCATCGILMRPAGSVYVCEGCGAIGPDVSPGIPTDPVS